MRFIRFCPICGEIWKDVGACCKKCERAYNAKNKIIRPKTDYDRRLREGFKLISTEEYLTANDFALPGKLF